VLQRSNEPEIADAEDAWLPARAQLRGQIALSHRRRSDNAGFKAGNIGDFCGRWGKTHDLGSCSMPTA